MEKIIFIFIGAIVLTVSIFLISFYSWNFFDKRKPNHNLTNLEIVLSDEGKVDLTEQTPINNSDGKNNIPYIFSVKNNGNVSAKYQVLIEDFISDYSMDFLSRKCLNYELRQGGVTKKIGNLSEIKNNVIYNDIILYNETKSYEFRLWVDENALAVDWVGKVYNYNIKVNPIVE